MTWQDKLSAAERKELDRAKQRRDKEAAAYNAVRIKLKNRADARTRLEKARSKPPAT